MGKGVSNTQEGSISDMALVYKEDCDLLMQQMKQLVDVRKNLEPLNLRHCTEDSLSCLIFQLQEIIKAIWPIPSHVIEIHMISKKVLLRDLRTALIELLLAQDQLAAKGRNPRFYKHLLVCQENLGCVFDIDVDSIGFSSRIKRPSQQISSQKTFPLHVQKYYTDFLTAQGMLERAKLSSMSGDDDSVEQFDCVNEALNVLYALVQELNYFSNQNSYFQEDTFSTSYQFFINISYLKEQIPRLLELIKTFHLAYDSSSRQAQKISKEIAYQLEAIVHSSREVPPTLSTLLKLPHLQRENGGYLHLIYSSENG